MRPAFAIFFLLMTAVTCVGSSPPSIFRYSEESSPNGLDPAQAVSVFDSALIWNLYDTLYTYKYLKRPYELKPCLAAALPKISSDRLTYTIPIKKGVFFIDDPAFPKGKGREVTATDVVYSIRRHFDPKSGSRNEWLWRDRIVGLDEWKHAGSKVSADVEGLKALDPYTVQIKLKRPFSPFVYTLAMAASAIVPREAVERYGREFSVNAVGSGPFRLKSLDNRKAVLVRNPGFRKETLDLAAEGYSASLHGALGLERLDGKPYPFLDQLEIYFVEQASARWSSFFKGNEIQFTVLPPEQLDRVIASRAPIKLRPDYAKRYHAIALPEMGLLYEGFNMADPRVGNSTDPAQEKKNRALRCAIRKAYDWPGEIRRYYYGMGTAFPGVIPPMVEGFDQEVSKESVTRDVGVAKAMLKKNGWTAESLPVLEWGGVNSIRSRQYFELFRGWMLEIGYPAEKIKFLGFATWGDFSKAMAERKVMYMGMGYKMDYPDAENLLALFYGPNSSPGLNTLNYQNAKFDALYRKALEMPPSKARSELYAKMNRLIIDDCAAISGFSRTQIFLWPKSVTLYPDRDILGGSFLRYVSVNP